MKDALKLAKRDIISVTKVMYHISQGLINSFEQNDLYAGCVDNKAALNKNPSITQISKHLSGMQIKHPQIAALILKYIQQELKNNKKLAEVHLDPLMCPLDKLSDVLTIIGSSLLTCEEKIEVNLILDLSQEGIEYFVPCILRKTGRYYNLYIIEVASIINFEQKANQLIGKYNATSANNIRFNHLTIPSNMQYYANYVSFYYALIHLKMLSQLSDEALEAMWSTTSKLRFVEQVTNTIPLVKEMGHIINNYFKKICKLACDCTEEELNIISKSYHISCEIEHLSKQIQDRTRQAYHYEKLDKELLGDKFQNPLFVLPSNNLVKTGASCSLIRQAVKEKSSNNNKQSYTGWLDQQFQSTLNYLGFSQ
ncbi:hypothetical protein [Rickettsiales endosymbiont of Stachyamoeba lipophora]|uniref:hypothetical protein n=1 Tax=Rickettsiales endosymbiont of Stachyamoeba lipophora TaxID=2486578 RepID=UPI000F653B7C|nr:hypothetical protein [Rickettsiales endosymbiont of Stachyamoeba lipophora]AZL15197.1 hypothetical protein EF513_01305 [Rickettsiales endosymbiont of Stachyamoeba lipophora]